MREIGFVYAGDTGMLEARVSAFLEGLNSKGFAEGRNVTLEGVQPPRGSSRETGNGFPFALAILIFIAILVLGRIGRGPTRGVRRWGRGPWSGWSSGVGPFGGGWGGGGSSGGGGGFGGGFGGFGGGSSGGGGGGASW